MSKSANDELLSLNDDTQKENSHPNINDYSTNDLEEETRKIPPLMNALQEKKTDQIEFEAVKECNGS